MLPLVITYVKVVHQARELCTSDQAMHLSIECFVVTSNLYSCNIYGYIQFL